jgi:hypothetical protein
MDPPVGSSALEIRVGSFSAFNDIEAKEGA